MKKYIKDNKIKFRNEIIIKRNGTQIINPNEEQIFADGWIEYVIPELSESEKLNNAKRDMQYRIERYDSSDEVNCFYIGETPIWLDKATRSGLMLRFESELKLGDKHTTLWYNGIQYPLELTVALNMLYMIEKYASQCYDNTQLHLSNVNKLETIEDVQNYDYRVGYPEKLSF